MDLRIGDILIEKVPNRPQETHAYAKVVTVNNTTARLRWEPVATVRNYPSEGVVWPLREVRAQLTHRCYHCHLPHTAHADSGKCLYSPTHWRIDNDSQNR